MSGCQTNPENEKHRLIYFPGKTSIGISHLPSLSYRAINFEKWEILSPRKKLPGFFFTRVEGYHSREIFIPKLTVVKFTLYNDYISVSRIFFGLLTERNTVLDSHPNRNLTFIAILKPKTEQ